MSAVRLVDLTPSCSVDPVEVIGLQDATPKTEVRHLSDSKSMATPAGPPATRILLYRGDVHCELPIDEVRERLRGTRGDR